MSTVRRTDWTGPTPDLGWGGLYDPGPWRHCHRLPGVWDSDNGPIAGKVCAGCWDANRPVALAALPETPDNHRDDKEPRP